MHVSYNEWSLVPELVTQMALKRKNNFSTANEKSYILFHLKIMSQQTILKRC